MVSLQFRKNDIDKVFRYRIMGYSVVTVGIPFSAQALRSRKCAVMTSLSNGKPFMPTSQGWFKIADVCGNCDWCLFWHIICGCGFQTTPLSAIYLRLQIRSSQQGMMQTQYQNSQLASSQELLTAKTLNSWIRLTFRHLSLRCIFLETAKCFLRRWPLTGHNCTLLVSVKSDVKQFFESLEVTSKEVS